MLNNDLNSFRAGKPGIYPNVPREDYNKHPGFNFSSMREFQKSPKHYITYLNEPKESTPAMILGEAFHQAVLEEERFAAGYIQAPEHITSKASKEYKELVAANPGVEIFKFEDYSQLGGMKKAVYEHPDAAKILSVKENNELTLCWVDPLTEVLCKGRMDKYVSIAGIDTVVDLKTTEVAKEEDFLKSIINYNYHLQAYFYKSGLATLLSRRVEDCQYIIIAVEKSKPYGVIVYKMIGSWDVVAEKIINETLLNFSLVKDWGKCYDTGIQNLWCPDWLINKHLFKQ